MRGLNSIVALERAHACIVQCDHYVAQMQCLALPLLRYPCELSFATSSRRYQTTREGMSNFQRPGEGLWEG